MSKISECFDLFDKIGSTSSRLEKESLLKQGKGNEHFEKMMHLTYNPFMPFNIKKIPKVSLEGISTTEVKFVMFCNLLEKLHKREVTGNEAIDHVKSFFKKCNDEEYFWYSKILTKDLKIGITDKTINKIYPNLVPVFECQLAHPLKKFPKNFIVDRKLDGYRCLAFNYGGGLVQLFSRNGNVIEGYVDIEADVSKLPEGYVYDGEITSKSNKFSDTQSQVFKKSSNKEGLLNIFDMVPIKEFNNLESSDSLRIRLSKLDNLSNEIQSLENLSRVKPSEFLSGEDGAQKAYELHTVFVKEGFEGTMVKDLDSTYKCKRSYDVQKIKDMETLDLTVVRVEEGESKYEGMLGAFVVEFEDNEVHVGSGYTDADREQFWRERNNLVNRTIEVRFQEISTNKEGKKSLRFPVFLRFRDDK